MHRRDPEGVLRLVVPLLEDGVLRGVLDLDSPEKGRFDEEDARGLEEFAARLIRLVRWS